MSQWRRGLMIVVGFTGSAAVAGPMLRIPVDEAPSPEAITCELQCGVSYSVTLRDFDGKPLAGEIVRGCGDAELTDDRGAATLFGERASNVPTLYLQHGWFRSLPELCTATPEGEVTATFDPRPTGGLGVTLHDSPFLSDGIPIRRVYPDSAAGAAGLRAGDLILAVSDQTWERGVVIAESMLSTEHTDADNLWRYTTGPEGSTLTVRVKSPDQPPRDVLITRRMQDTPLGSR